jgi:cytochrome c oxidase assembly protein subunit 15
MFTTLVRLSIALAFIVIVLGAYTRLTDSGLGCPDWPGCYGSIAVPEAQSDIDTSNELYARPLEASKAWNEMIHRYVAATLGLCILAIALVSLKNRKSPGQQRALPLILLVLVIFQAALGMWTVTLLLKPIVVMGHLMGGMTILLLLFWLYLKTQPKPVVHTRSLSRLAALGLIVIYIQISLGGWTSANYAALVCPDLPTCQGEWWPDMDFSEGFVPWRGLGVDYEFGVLDGVARTAVHMSHRIGAIITLLIIGAIAIRSFRNENKKIKQAGGILFVVLLIQFSLGLSNIFFILPLGVAVAHNGVAALLLLSMGLLLYRTRYEAL